MAVVDQARIAAAAVTQGPYDLCCVASALTALRFRTDGVPWSCLFDAAAFICRTRVEPQHRVEAGNVVRRMFPDGQTPGAPSIGDEAWARLTSLPTVMPADRTLNDCLCDAGEALRALASEFPYDVKRGCCEPGAELQVTSDDELRAAIAEAVELGCPATLSVTVWQQSGLGHFVKTQGAGSHCVVVLDADDAALTLWDPDGGHVLPRIDWPALFEDFLDPPRHFGSRHGRKPGSGRATGWTMAVAHPRAVGELRSL